MAHELDFTASGTAAMFSVKETPWHREGHVLREAPSFDEALKIGGLDYEVKLQPLYALNRTPEGVSAIPAGSASAVVRMDRWPRPESILSTVTDKYAVLQNRECFETLTPLIDNGVALLETGGALRGGRDAWLMVRFKIDDPVVREVFADEVVPFCLIHNTHSGMRRAVIMETPVRVVCANTLSYAYTSVRQSRGRAIGVSHRGDARVRLIDAATQMFGGIVERYRAIADQYATMRATILSVDEFTRGVLDLLAPLPEADDAMDRAARKSFDRAMDKATAKRVELRRLWVHGDGHTGNRSAWEAYNGAVQALDHDDSEFAVRGSRVQSLVDGKLHDAKARLAQSVMALCRK